MKDRPTGQPLSVPIGRFSCGSPAIPAVQVSRITRVRKWSISSGEPSMSGAMQGAVGSARMRARLDGLQDVVARLRVHVARGLHVGFAHARREFDALAHAGPDRRPLRA